MRSLSFAVLTLAALGCGDDPVGTDLDAAPEPDAQVEVGLDVADLDASAADLDASAGPDANEGDRGPDADPADGGVADMGADAQPCVSPIPGCCPQSPFVWPTTGTPTQTLISATYGPREQFSAGGRYDWHQGIDLPGHDDDEGFNDPVYATADGTVYRIGNLPGGGRGAIANFSETSGNVIVLAHTDDDTGLAEGDIYSLYLHVDAMDLSALTARLDGALTVVDFTEYYFLDGDDTRSGNRGKPRDTFKTTGEPIDAYPRFARGDAMAMIGDSGSVIDFEHLHFELRDRAEPAMSPSGFNREWARNPYTFLPHPNLTSHTVEIADREDSVAITVRIERDGVPRGDPLVGLQDLDVARIRLEIRENADVVDAREFRFFEDINIVGTERFDDNDLGFDHEDFLSSAYVDLEPDRSLGGVNVRLDPTPFTSFTDTWELVVEFSGLLDAGFVPSSGQRYAVSVDDVCNNRATATLPPAP